MLANVPMEDAKLYTCLSGVAVRIDSDHPCWENRLQPLLPVRLPKARPPELLIADDHIEVTIVVQVNEANAVIAAIRSAERMTGQERLVQPLLSFAESEELHALAVPAHGVIDEFHHLLAANPAMRMENKIECALLPDGYVQRSFPVGHSRHIGHAM